MGRKTTFYHDIQRLMMEYVMCPLIGPRGGLVLAFTPEYACEACYDRGILGFDKRSAVLDYLSIDNAEPGLIVKAAGV
jgi:hypothetical protein